MSGKTELKQTAKRIILYLLLEFVLMVFCQIVALPVRQAEATPANSIHQKASALKIGVASMITPVDAVKYYQDVIDYIGEQIGQPGQMVPRRTYDEMDSLLEKGEVKVAFICSAPYVKNREQFGIELLRLRA